MGSSHTLQWIDSTFELCCSPLQNFHGERELYSSDHEDEISSATIMSRVLVHSIDEYSVGAGSGQAAGSDCRARS